MFFSICIHDSATYLLTPVYCCLAKPYPDAQVAHCLCGPRGPCKYTIKEGVQIPEGFLGNIVPKTRAVFGHEVLEVLVLPLLWAALEDEVTVNGTKCNFLPSALRDEIKRKWLSLGGEDSNPIEIFRFEYNSWAISS